MKKAILLMAVVLFSALAMGQTTLTLNDYWIYWMTPQGTVLGGFTIDGNFATRGNVAVGNDLTVAGDMTLGGALGITGDLEVTGDLAVDGATVVLDGSTSVRGISAGFTSLEAPAIRLGVNSSIYMAIAVSDTTGNVAITHTGGTTGNVDWTAAAFGFTGDTTITGDLEVTGTLTVSSGLTWTPPLVVGGSIYHTGATNSSALMVSSNTLAYTDTTAKNLFVLPANAIVTDVVVVVTTACNGDGTHLLSVGVTGATTKWVNALDVKSSTGVFRMGSSGAMPFAGIGTVGATDVTVIGSIPAGGTAGDAGSVTVYIYWYLAP